MLKAIKYALIESHYNDEGWSHTIVTRMFLTELYQAS